MKEKLVYLRKDGRWEARYKKGVSPEGKTIYGAVYGSTKEEVLKRRSLITGAPEAAEICQPTEMNLLILGAGTHGRDVYEIAESLHLFQKIRFLDDMTEGTNIIGKCRDAVQFRKQYPCALIAIGDNVIRKKYAKLLKECGFLAPNGSTESTEELALLYNSADVLFNASMEESFGKVSAEALACGTPLICFPTTANPELADDGCGEIVSVDDYPALLQAVEKIANMKSKLSQKCLCKAKNSFSIKKNTAAYIDLYNR